MTRLDSPDRIGPGGPTARPAAPPDTARPAAPPDTPFLSVVVPVRDEAPFIARTLGRLFATAYDPARFEVIVVDGGSTDGTWAIVDGLRARYPNLELQPNPARLSSAARNIGVRRARGDLIAIVDGHCELEADDYLAAVADAFARSGADCLGRPQPLDVAGATAFQRAVAAARSSWLGHHPESHIHDDDEKLVRPQSVAVAYRREVFERVGLFDETFDACEDVEFNHRVDRAGLRCLLAPSIRARYHPRAGPGALARQLVRYGRGRVRLLRKHPETFSAPGFVPAAFVLGLAAGPVLAALSPWLAWAYAGSLALYTLLVAAASLQLAARPGGLRLLPWLPSVFLTIHVASGAGILRELLAGRRRPRGSAP